MASKAVVDAVTTRLAANWTSTPIIAPNDGSSVPDDNSAFMVLTFPVANETMISVGAPGSNTYREEGAFRIVLAVPIGSGLATYSQLIDTLRIAFRGQVFSGVRVFEVPPPSIDDSSDDGAYFEFSFACPYEYDIFG